MIKIKNTQYTQTNSVDNLSTFEIYIHCLCIKKAYSCVRFGTDFPKYII